MSLVTCIVLVAGGYSQIRGVGYNEVFSPVVRRDMIRFLFAHVACTVIDLKQVDIKTAFLHGIATVTERFDRDIDVDMRRRSSGKILMHRSLTM